VILGQEYGDNRQVVVKDMAGGEQKVVHVDEFLAS
jgi:histidyl-tRNA synthetase